MNHVDKGGHTPIELASSAGSMPMVALLLQHARRVRRDVEFLSVKARARRRRRRRLHHITRVAFPLSELLRLSSPAPLPPPPSSRSRPGARPRRGRGHGRREEPAITKKKREDYDMHLRKLEQERLEFAALVAREEEKRREKFQREIENRKEKRRARNAAKLQASVEAKALKAEEGRRAHERERLNQQTLVAAPTARTGLGQARPSKWAYREAARDEMKQVSTFDEAKALSRTRAASRRARCCSGAGARPRGSS